MHYAETHIVPLGIRAGYPSNIDFEDISNRIINIKDDLQNHKWQTRKLVPEFSIKHLQ